MQAADELQTWLNAYIEDNRAVAGTVHEREAENLLLRASVNLPPTLIERVQSIPRGKGMAGLAFERNRPVQTCNLKEDRTGDVRPGAREADANAAAAIPVHDGSGDVRGVVGIAFVEEREIDETEMARLTAQAERAPF